MKKNPESARFQGTDISGKLTDIRIRPLAVASCGDNLESRDCFREQRKPLSQYQDRQPSRKWRTRTP